MFDKHINKLENCTLFQILLMFCNIGDLFSVQTTSASLCHSFEFRDEGSLIIVMEELRMETSGEKIISRPFLLYSC